MPSKFGMNSAVQCQKVKPSDQICNNPVQQIVPENCKEFELPSVPKTDFGINNIWYQQYNYYGCYNQYPLQYFPMSLNTGFYQYDQHQNMYLQNCVQNNYAVPNVYDAPCFIPPKVPTEYFKIDVNARYYEKIYNPLN